MSTIPVENKGIYHVVKADADGLRKAGYASVSHVPFVIRSDCYYPSTINRYIRGRALCEIDLKFGSDAPESISRKRFLTQLSCESVAKNMKAFLNRFGDDWKSLDYVTDLMQWQYGLIDGTASESGKPLGPNRVNSLIAEACYFLTWASSIRDSRGEPLRVPFLVKTNSSTRARHDGKRSKGHKNGIAVSSRVGAVRPKASSLMLPSPKEVGLWMRSMRVRYDVKSLEAECAISVGLRASEIIDLEVDDIPPRGQWDGLIRGGCLPVTICHGNKGGKISPASNVSANPRVVLFPLDLAERIDEYRTQIRPMQLVRWINQASDQKEKHRRQRAPKTKKMWLSEWSNQPHSYQRLYDAWTKVPHCPPEWHPHAGREYYAVESVVSYVRDTLEMNQSGTVPNLTWLEGAMSSQVKLLLSPTMGHVDEETTMKYLRYVHVRLIEEFEHPSISWQLYCEDEMDVND